MSRLVYRLASPTSDRHITGQVEDATLRSTSPGGFSSVELSLHKPILAADIAQFDQVFAYDAATAEQVGGGRLEDPDLTTGDSGEVWSLTAIGMGPAHTQDIERSYIALDSSMDAWEPFTRSLLSLSAEVGAGPPDSSVDQVMLFSFPRGAVVVSGDQASTTYRLLADAGLLLGAYGYRQRPGSSPSDFTTRAVTTISDGAGTSILNDAWSGGNTTRSLYCSTDFLTTQNQPIIRGVYTGAGTTVPNDVRYVSVDNVWVAAQRVNKSGTTLTGSSNYGSTVLLSQVVEDLLGGGMLPLFDGPNSTIATTTHGIDQAAWPDGVTAAEVLDDLLELESAYTWHVWGQGTNGKWPFELVPWPTTVRYEYTVADGFDSPSSGADLYDQVQVRGVNANGKRRNRLRTSTVGTLTKAGIHRRAVLDLGDEVYSSANADRAGDRFLADHAVPPNAGTLQIAGPVHDLITGRTVPPYMVRPGNLIRVRGTRPAIDALNATDRDGSTTFRIVSNEYRESDASSSLELDSFTATQARQIARAASRRRKR